jgi:outer membrane protein
MLKKIILAALCLMPMVAFAQSFKFGNVSTSELFEAMPEKAQFQKEMSDLQSSYENELSKMGEEYQAKVTDFMATRDSLPQNIVETRAQEIDQLQQRIQNFRELAAKDFQNQQQQKVAPILEKIHKAISTVAQKNGFTYIFDLDANNILYYSPELCVFVLPLVKTVLGIK